MTDNANSTQFGVDPTICILAMIAGIGMANAVDTTIIKFSNTGTLTETTVKASLSGQPTSGANTTLLNNYSLGSTGIKMSATANENCKLWDNDGTFTSSWSNDKALATMNADLQTNITASDLVSNKFVYTGTQESRLSTVSFDLTNSVYNAGSHIVLYLGVSALTSIPTSLSVTGGLADSSVSYAYNGSDGFVSSISGVTAKNLVLVRIEGDLLNTSVESVDKQIVALSFAGGTKSGINMVAIVPEPATATLSLLALAGLATRRRRK